jgi:DNA-binding MarR family transcriptional regulator
MPQSTASITAHPSRPEVARSVAIVTTFLEALQEASGDPHMSIPQLLLLVQLHVHGQLAQQDLPKYTRVQKSANSRNVAKMGPGEKPHMKPGPGWVDSYDDPLDRRTRLCRLTPNGRALVDTAALAATRFSLPKPLPQNG